MTVAERIAALRAETGDTLLAPTPMPTVEQLGVGWSVWELAPADTQYTPRGGVVVHIDATHDEDTGEAMDRYLLVRPGRGGLHWVSLRANQVSRPERPNAVTIRGVCQVAARELAADKRSPDDRRSLELWSLGTRLMSVLGAPGVVPPR